MTSLGIICEHCEKEFTSNDELYKTNCGHIYHKECRIKTKLSAQKLYPVFKQYEFSQTLERMLSLNESHEEEMKKLLDLQRFALSKLRQQQADTQSNEPSTSDNNQEEANN